MSRPTVAKVADFLLYLRRSLSLAYSSFASYRSMLSGVFRFVLPEISTHFVLHYLPRSFCLECPLSSSRVPPWDLVRVLHFLRGPPFEPLASCSLRDLTQKVLFLVSLATARRVEELQVVSWEVSFSGSDVFLSHLPEFRAKTESKVNPLPRSFCVRSLADFVGNLPEELLLCPVRALWHYYISLVLLLFLCVLVLVLYLLALLLGLSLRTLLASFFAMSSPVVPLPPRLLLVPPLFLLLALLPLLGLIVFMGSRLHGSLRGMSLFPLSLQRLLGLQLLSLPPPLSLMSSFLLHKVLVWVLWWRRVPWYRSF